jgi:lipopolysaccharide export system protein LptA
VSKLQNILAGCLVVAGLALSTLGAQAQSTSGARDPIDIKSDRLEAFNKERKIVFIGNVQARQRDTLIFADRLTTFYDKDGKEVERILAVGNVRITQDEKVATGREAVFDNRRRKIVMTGDPHLWQGRDELRGEVITVFIDEDRVIVDRARGVFTPNRAAEPPRPRAGSSVTEPTGPGDGGGGDALAPVAGEVAP